MPTFNLLNEIARQLTFYKDKAESIEEWHGRILYSVLGKLALASLWDSPDDWNDEFSVQTFKAKIKKNADYYRKIVNLNCPYLCDSQAIANEIYTLYRKSGFIYHRDNWIFPSICTSYRSENIYLIRNGNPLAYRHISGLGEYSTHEEPADKRCGKLTEMFALHTVPFAEAVEEYIRNAAWKAVDEFPDGTEFLEQQEFKKGYWRNAPDHGIDVSLLRTPLAGNRYYYFYKKSDNGWEWSQIPSWLTNPVIDKGEAREWLVIATGLLMRHASFPAIVTTTSNKLITISLPYLLPPAEEAFFELYSWPLHSNSLTDFQQHYTRKMSIDVFPIFKSAMEQLGYKFIETP